MSYKIGQEVQLNGATYKIVGTVKKSFLLEKDGKQYKATADKLGKIEKQNERQAQQASVKYPFLERKLAWKQIFDKTAALPTNEAECLNWFFQLSGELSPENLACDGEASAAHIRNSLRDIRGAWKELETICGRRFSEDEIESLAMKEYLSKRA